MQDNNNNIIILCLTLFFVIQIGLFYEADNEAQIAHGFYNTSSDKRFTREQ